MHAQNLLVNGDFSAGNTGFTTAYFFVPSGQSETADTYGIRTNSLDFNPGYTSFGDHTTGTGLMMLVDGYPAPNMIAWSETVNVATGTEYEFSAWTASSDPANPGVLQFSINGGQIGSNFSLSANGGQWQQFTAAWNSGSNTSAILAIVDTNTISSGNDFALDDLSFMASQNLLVNGDFSEGNTGFTTAYFFIASGQSETPDTYGIRTSSLDFNPYYTSFGDHTTGTGLMLLLDGYPAPNMIAWSETVNVATGTEYEFSGWTTSSDPTNPGTLQFSINGAQIGSDFPLSTNAGVWQQFTAAWNSGSNTSAILAIVDSNTISLGNDFALDDLSLKVAVPSLSIALSKAPSVTTNAQSVIISWPSVFTNYVLQQNPALGSTNWVSNTNTVSLVNGTNQVVISPATNKMFFQLVQP